MAKEFLGVGWKFPLQLNAAEEVALSQHEQDIQEAIWIILSTAPGERLMRPDFGCGIHRYVFAPNDTGTAGLVGFAVEDALIQWEPRIELNEVNVAPDTENPAVMLIHIDYKVRETDTRFNLVYPFYLERGEL
ncbi:MAG: GPW/gp25 family protein [Gammaproteobacteria bacterium]|jgi:phage baseplate assembly protein W